MTVAQDMVLLLAAPPRLGPSRLGVAALCRLCAQNPHCHTADGLCMSMHSHYTMIGDASHATVGRRHDRNRGLGFPQVRPGSAESGGTGCAPTDRSTLWGQTNSTHLTFNTSMYAPPAPPEHVWQRPSCDRRSASAPQQPDEPDATTTISPVESSAEPCWRCFHGLRVVYSTHVMPAAHAVWVYRAPNRSICVACPSPMCPNP